MTSNSFSSRMFAVWMVIVIVSMTGYCPTAATPVDNTTGALTFLSEFGYIAPSEGGGVRLDGDNSPSEDVIKMAIKEYQAFMGLPETGTLDEATLQDMEEPRCGTKDKFSESDSDRFALQGSRWTKSTLTYKISKYPRRSLSRSETNQAIRESFNKWSQVTPLRFVRKNSGPVDIDIKFVTGAHGHENIFDGRGYKLAHASYPRGKHEGYAHFDDDENWTMDFSGSNVRHTALYVYPVAGSNVRHTALHEFGHSLGLRHSKVRGAVMYPKYQPVIELHQDDIKGIRTLYPFSKRR